MAALCARDFVSLAGLAPSAMGPWWQIGGHRCCYSRNNESVRRDGLLGASLGEKGIEASCPNQVILALTLKSMQRQYSP